MKLRTITPPILALALAIAPLHHLHAQPTPGASTTGPAAATPPAASSEVDARLASLRRSVENLSDIKMVLDRYARFIDQYKQTPAAREAERDVAMWRERQDKGMVKVGSQWVTPAEREGLKKKGQATAQEARDALLEAKAKEAEALIARALEEDPGNISATYLKGVLLCQQGQLPQARKYFEAVAVAGGGAASSTTKPSPSVAALNNLAVIQWRTAPDSPAMAMGFYEKAMNAAPLDVRILHNVAEAINALPANQRSTVVAQNAIRLFESQQAVLLKKMEQDGMHPWGSSWVDEPTLARLEAADKAIQKQVAALSGEYDKLQKTVNDASADIEGNKRTMQLYVNASHHTDSKGRAYDTPLPAEYYNLQRKNDGLQNTLTSLRSQQMALRSQATAAQRTLPLQKYSGVQKLLGAEATPGMPPPPAKGATTRPSSESARRRSD
jgi:tetratricopeptide (TPR) repeat protein